MRRRILYCLGLLAAASLMLAAGAGSPPAQQAGQAPVVLVAQVQGGIGPASDRFVRRVLEEAARRDARAVVLEMDTPGGLATSMRDIIQNILGSRVPVVTYVAPQGARAASAGTYILYASHVAAMAPATNLGAATPVPVGGSSPLPGGQQEEQPADGQDGQQQEGQDQGEQGGDAMSRKMVNDAVAYIRSLAELRGRNADWAQRAVREAASLSAEQALEMNVIDLVAADTAELLRRIDGRQVQAGGRTVTLETEGVPVERIEPGWLTEFLSVITNPNIALILMMIGFYGLIFEFWNPGTIGPGVAGAICLVIGLYALNTLPLDYTGLALLLLGIGFMIAEAFVPSFGALGAGGVVAFVLGGILLMDTDTPGFHLSAWVVAGTGIVSALFIGLIVTFAVRAHRRPAVTGAAEVVGQRASVSQWSKGEGYVHVRGEEWHATSKAKLKAGDAVTVEAMDGLTLTVRPADSDSEGGKS